MLWIYFATLVMFNVVNFNFDVKSIIFSLILARALFPKLLEKALNMSYSGGEVQP